ncbi:protease Do-like 7 isoform X1 [Gossypium australe]|uniref:Protease Do-like 7 isoform X1 n=1 Tax=Gossypium australe TaxID=47621 RepID=A0A5B6W079_9ROSI|nr:protease Do-like 7 isoform X1 [Gossypium australe]
MKTKHLYTVCKKIILVFNYLIFVIKKLKPNESWQNNLKILNQFNNFNIKGYVVFIFLISLLKNLY